MSDPAILLPGWGTPPERLLPLRDALAEAGWDARVGGYLPDTTIDVLARRLVGALGDAPVHLVGHSLGGLIAAQAALDAPDRVASVTTINTPWRGTWVGYTGPSALAVSLRWRSPTLRELRDRLDAHLELDQGPRWLLVGCAGDLATPPSTSVRAGTSGPRLSRVILPVGGHSVSLVHPRLVAHVVTAAQASDGAPACG